jgi:DNA-directed RNA polymerase subunit RPC12/RpoP
MPSLSYGRHTYCIKINPCISKYISKENKPTEFLKKLNWEYSDRFAIISPVEYLLEYGGKIKTSNNNVILCSSPEEFGSVLYEIKYRQYKWKTNNQLSRYEHFKRYILQNNRKEFEDFISCIDSILNTETYSKFVLQCTLDELKEYRESKKDPLSFSPKDVISNCDHKSLLKNISKTFPLEIEVEKAYLSYKNYYIKNILAEKVNKSVKQLHKLYTDFLKLDWESENFSHYTENDIAGKRWKDKLQEDVKKLSTLVNQEKLKVKNLLKRYGITKENVINFRNTKLGASLISFEKELRKFSSVVENKKKKLEELHSQHQKRKIKTYLFFFITAVGLFLIWNKYFRLRCPNCGSTELELIKEYVISERWKHSRKDGGPDMRYKDNKLIQTIRKEYRCNKCNYIFSQVEEREK